MLVKIRGLSRCVFWAWCRGYMVALTFDVFARSFNDFYQHIPAFGASLRIIGYNGGCMLTEAASR